jgi:glucokinase
MTHQPLIPTARAVAPLFWGIDVGGTNIKFGLVDSHGQTIAFESVRTLEPEGPAAAVERVVTGIQRLEGQIDVSRSQVARVGLGSPGSMDLPAGMLVEPPNLPHWWNFPIRDAFAQRLGLEVTFLNDANAAAYGEFWLGAGREHSSMILLTLGTGVGGGIIVADELINGVNSFGSECGHILVDSRPDARLCVWGGGRGQLEAYASAGAVVDRMRERMKATAEQARAADRMDADELTAKLIYQAAEAGDPLALEVIDETARWLGIGVTTLVHTIDPGLVVLGGAMNFGGPQSVVGRRFLAGVRKEFQERTFANVFRGTTIEFATLGGDAGYLGAAGYARKEFSARAAASSGGGRG